MIKPAGKSLKKFAFPITLLVIGGLAHFIFRSDSQLERSLHFHADWTALLVLSIFGRIYLVGWINQIALKELGANIGRWEMFSLACIANTLNMFMPFKSGILFRAIYFKRRYKLAYTHFASTQIGVQMMWILAACGISVIALLAIGNLSDPVILTGIAVCGLCFVGAMVAINFPRINRRGHRIWDKLALASEGCHTLRSNRQLMLKMFWLACLKAIFDGVTFWLGCKAVGLPSNPVGILALTGFASIAMCMSITPGSLGTYEALIGIISKAAMLTPAEGVAVSLIIRGAGYVAIAVLFPLCSWWLFSRHGWRWNESAEIDEKGALPIETRSRAA